MAGLVQHACVQCMQEAADVACQQLGFETGLWHNLLLIPPDFPIAPPWLRELGCDGSEASVLDCERPEFGDTIECGRPQRLFCTSAGAPSSPLPLIFQAPPPAGVWRTCLLERRAQRQTWLVATKRPGTLGLPVPGDSSTVRHKPQHCCHNSHAKKLTGQRHAGRPGHSAA